VEHTASTPPHLWPAAIPEAAANRIAGEQRIPVAEVHRLYADFRKIKATYIHKDGPPESEANALDQFEGWIISHKPKRNSRAYGQTADYSGVKDSQGWGAAAAHFGGPVNPGASAALSEPDGWRELAANDEGLKWAAKDEWATMNPHYQKQMIELVKGATPNA
jgi:hypothetical protein